MYLKIALGNIKHAFADYSVYFLTLIIVSTVGIAFLLLAAYSAVTCSQCSRMLIPKKA